MAVSGIGVQPVTPTMGTPAERKNPTPQPSEEKRVAADRTPPAPGTGQRVDKVA